MSDATSSPPQLDPAPSNFDRLRANLTNGSLAIALLDSWLTGLPSTAQERMLSAVDQHVTKSQTTK
ncbi:hypothetical protein NLM27_02840 [Bradyrhizobium sp. CCGB12]|uniref:hypothetical protein n=1 Tax=Bradyrhizobium sp. CCGB12 TaxID=2949632 RepID=UPI0020B2DB98|nr:hypothetical protein [Bradyrhizobium sp. CCGB12]MCP3387716.1 hypothetical protein [Bradyrhizobium sp. CCGB12]